MWYMCVVWCVLCDMLVKFSSGDRISCFSYISHILSLEEKLLMLC